MSRKGNAVLNYLTLIFVCQLLGELFVQWSGLSLPGPVIGMVLLFAFMVLNRRYTKDVAGLDESGIPADLAKVGDVLLNHLSLLFVPAGVGIMVHFSLLENDWLALSVALVCSTVLTIVVTAGVMVFFNRGLDIDQPRAGEKR